MISRVPTVLAVPAARVLAIQAAPEEPHGMKALARIGAQLSTHGDQAPAFGRALRGVAFSAPKPRTRLDLASLSAFGGVQLLFFGGKGGVGKTTVAAAVAVRLARRAPDSRILLMSTDPAHSLGDVFDRPVGDRPATIAGGPRNLYVRELDAAEAFARKRREFETAFDTLGSRKLLDLAPPGVDELFGILSVIESRGRYARLVIDTAPTGHALRLLETPELARRWVQLLMRVLLKYRSITPPGRLGAELLDLSRSLRVLQSLLSDHRQTRFITVTRAARLPRVETTRLMRRLAQLHLAMPACIVNAMTLAPGACPRCRTNASAERREFLAIRRLCSRSHGCAIIQTPLAAPPPRGVAALDDWVTRWRIA